MRHTLDDLLRVAVIGSVESGLSSVGSAISSGLSSLGSDISGLF
jgi:hypothetical protein